MLRWYVWGNEKAGFVSIWILSKNGTVVPLGELEKDKLPEESIYECPYN